MNESICPLLSVSGRAPCPCISNCAWHDVTGGCALVVVADHLDRIASVQEEANGL